MAQPTKNPGPMRPPSNEAPVGILPDRREGSDIVSVSPTTAGPPGTRTSSNPELRLIAVHANARAKPALKNGRSPIARHNPGSRTPPHSARTLLTTSTTATGAAFPSYNFLCAIDRRPRHSVDRPSSSDGTAPASSVGRAGLRADPCAEPASRGSIPSLEVPSLAAITFFRQLRSSCSGRAFRASSFPTSRN